MIAKIMPLTYCICQRKKVCMSYTLFSILNKIFIFCTFHKWNVFIVFWRIIFANFLHSTAGITLNRTFPRRLCTHQVYCLYLANLKAPEPFSIGSPSRLFSAESALINKLSKTNKSELSGIGDAVMSCIDKIKM